MPAYFVAVLLTSVAAYLHTLSSKPEMRPESRLADLFWRGLSTAALLVWVALILNGFAHRHWSDALAALLGSFAVNWWFGHRGAKPTWPGLSMLLGAVGVGLGIYSLLYE